MTIQSISKALTLIASATLASCLAAGAQNSMGDVHNNSGIVTQGQIGNNTVNQYGAPPPTYQVVGERPAQRADDGTYVKTVFILVSTAAPANNIFVAVPKSQVSNKVQVPFWPIKVALASGVSSISSGQSDNAYWSKASPVTPGEYAIEVRVDDPDSKPTVLIVFNKS